MKKLAVRVTAIVALLLPAAFVTTRPAGADPVPIEVDNVDDQIEKIEASVRQVGTDLVAQVRNDILRVCAETVGTSSDTLDTITWTVNNDPVIWGLFNPEIRDALLDEGGFIIQVTGDPCDIIRTGHSAVCYGITSGTTFFMTGCIPID